MNANLISYPFYAADKFLSFDLINFFYITTSTIIYSSSILFLLQLLHFSSTHFQWEDHHVVKKLV